MSRSRSLSVLFVPLVALVVAGCGGSHSTSSTPVTPGTYRGTVNLTAEGGGANLSRSGPIVISVSPDQVVTVGSFGSAPLNRRHFTLTTPASQLNSSTISCPLGTITNEGTFHDTTVDGTVSSIGIVCNGFALALTGNFHATLATEARSGQSDADALEVVRAAVQQIVGGR